MSSFDESKVTRGQPANDGQFAGKANSEPESTLPTPKPYVPGTLGGYSIRNYHAHRAGMEGGGFTASIYRDGKRVLEASNDGNGGAHLYRPIFPRVTPGGVDEFAALEATARRVMGREDSDFFEPDLFVTLAQAVGDIHRGAGRIRVLYSEAAAAALADSAWDHVREIVVHPEAF